MNRIHDQIRQILETTPGLTQKGLAEHMALPPASVNRMLYNQRKIMAEEIPIIEDYLGVRLNLSAPAVQNFEYKQEAMGGKKGFSDVPAQGLERLPPMVPVYSASSKGLGSSPAVDWAPRHPAQCTAEAFAVYTSSGEMEPRYFQGELVYVHPGRPPEANRDCIIEMKNGDILIRRCLRQNEAKIRVAQFNPPAEKEIRRDDIKIIYAIVGRG